MKLTTALRYSFLGLYFFSTPAAAQTLSVELKKDDHRLDAWLFERGLSEQEIVDRKILKNINLPVCEIQKLDNGTTVKRLYSKDFSYGIEYNIKMLDLSPHGAYRYLLKAMYSKPVNIDLKKMKCLDQEHIVKVASFKGVFEIPSSETPIEFKSNGYVLTITP